MMSLAAPKHTTRHRRLLVTDAHWVQRIFDLIGRVAAPADGPNLDVLDLLDPPRPAPSSSLDAFRIKSAAIVFAAAPLAGPVVAPPPRFWVDVETDFVWSA